MSAALILGGIVTWLVLCAFATVVLGRFFAVANAQHHRRMSQEQASRDGQPDRLRGVSDGGEVDHIHADFSLTFRERNHG